MILISLKAHHKNRSQCISGMLIKLKLVDLAIQTSHVNFHFNRHNPEIHSLVKSAYVTLLFSFFKHLELTLIGKLQPHQFSF